MQNLIAFLTKNFHWLLFFVLEIVSGVLLFRYNNYQGSLWVSSANALTGKVHEWQADIEQFFHLSDRAWQLAVRNVELEHELSRARQEIAELKGDTCVMDSIMDSVVKELHLMQAKVVSSTLRRRDNLLTIDRGTNDGVKPDMGVMSGVGLVGVVYMASSHYSIVIPLINVHSRISCSIRGSGYFGYLVWDGQNTAEAYMDDVPRHAQVKIGEYVETSGYSDIFPPGLTVGKIVGVGNSADGLSYRLRIRLSTDFGNLREVSLITDEQFPERMQLLKAARDSLAMAN